MVVGRKAKLPSLLIFSYVNRRVGSESTGAIEYVTGSHENWLKSCYLAHSVCFDTLLLSCTLAISKHLSIYIY